MAIASITSLKDQLIHRINESTIDVKIDKIFILTKIQIAKINKYLGEMIKLVPVLHKTFASTAQRASTKINTLWESNISPCERRDPV